MKYSILLALGLAFGTAAKAQDIKITGLKRVFSGNQEWYIETTAGRGSLKRVYSDASEWEIILPTHGKFSVKQSYSGDKTDWIISNKDSSINFVVSFDKDLNVWRTGEEGKFIYLETVFKNNYGDWKVTDAIGDFSIKNRFTDGSEWLVKDQLQNEKLIVKLSLVCIPILIRK